MGHLVGKEVFRELGRKIDGLDMRAPWNDRLRGVLEGLYTREEAEVVVKMPYGLSTFGQLERATGYDAPDLQRVLDSLTGKGLAVDIWVNEAYHYTPSPLIVGIFEFTMMRMGPDTNSREWAGLLHDYLEGDDAFMEANLGKGEKFTFQRTLPHEAAIDPGECFEILDHEKASALLAESDSFAIGYCSCRHEKSHLGKKNCDISLESCTQFGRAADFMNRHNLARKVDRSEMADLFAMSREKGLVLSADNVQKNMRFVCHCCKCCCVPLLAVRERGYPNALVTSNFIAGIKEDECVGCGLCAKACPIDAIAMVASEKPELRKKQDARVDTSLCLGCGVCALKCPSKACRLTKRGRRVITPETTFERIMLQSLERGTLQNQIFADPKSVNEKFMRAFVGAFLRFPPVKKALLSDRLRSRFLAAMKDGVTKQGKGWITSL